MYVLFPKHVNDFGKIRTCFFRKTMEDFIIKKYTIRYTKDEGWSLSLYQKNYTKSIFF